MRKWLIVLVAALTLTIGFSSTALAGSGVKVTHATLPSSYVDENDTFFPATCRVIQVITGNHRLEAFRCTFDADVPAPVVCDTALGCQWFSDFDGALAVKTHFVITKSGIMWGWASF